MSVIISKNNKSQYFRSEAARLSSFNNKKKTWLVKEPGQIVEDQKSDSIPAHNDTNLFNEESNIGISFSNNENDDFDPTKPYIYSLGFTNSLPNQSKEIEEEKAEGGLDSQPSEVPMFKNADASYIQEQSS